MRLIVCAFACVLVATAVRAEDLLGVIAQHVAASRSVERSTSHVNGTVGLLVLSKQDLRGTSARGKHSAVAVSGAGDVVGVLLKPSGLVVCEFSGVYDGQCLSLSGCVSGTRCL
jgi:hypothetical protein